MPGPGEKLPQSGHVEDRRPAAHPDPFGRVGGGGQVVSRALHRHGEGQEGRHSDERVPTFGCAEDSLEEPGAPQEVLNAAAPGPKGGAPFAGGRVHLGRRGQQRQVPVGEVLQIGRGDHSVIRIHAG